jgi:hypothetical protein
MMKLNKRIKMFEDFAGTAMDSSNNTAPASKTVTGSVAVDKTNVKSETAAKSKAEGEKVRADVIKDVDTILTNLSKLSKSIEESYSINEDQMSDLISGLKSQFAIAKATMMLDKYKTLLMAADPTAQKNEATLGGAKIQKKIKELTDSISGKGISPEQKEKVAKQKAKLQDKMSGVEQQATMAGEKAKNGLSEFETKLSDVEGPISKDSELGKVYQAKKARLKNQVREEAMATALEIAKKQGKKDAAKALAEDLKEIADKQKEMEDKIKSGEELGKEDVAELKGIQAYMKEIDGIMKSREAVKAVTAEVEKVAAGISESLAAFGAVILENSVSDLFSKAKGASDAEALTQAKELASKMKTAAAAELAAVTALAGAISGKEVTKSVVGLAGGDMDAAEETEGGYKLSTFIAKYGGGSSIVGADEFASIKAADEVLADVDAAIASAKEEDDDTGKGKTDPVKTDDDDDKNSKKGMIDRYKALIAKTDDEEKKQKYQDKIDKLSATEESKFLDPDFVAVLEAELLEFENSINETEEVAEEAGEGDVEVADEVEETEEVEESVEQPKKVKLYEGMSIADRFKALM